WMCAAALFATILGAAVFTRWPYHRYVSFEPLISVDLDGDWWGIWWTDPYPKSAPRLAYVDPQQHEFRISSSLSVALCGIALAWLWLLDRRRPLPGHCRKCNYDLTGNTSGVCPECRTAVSESRKWEAGSGK